jgi:hypothetical protein
VGKGAGRDDFRETHDDQFAQVPAHLIHIRFEWTVRFVFKRLRSDLLDVLLTVVNSVGRDGDPANETSRGIGGGVELNGELKVVQPILDGEERSERRWWWTVVAPGRPGTAGEIDQDLAGSEILHEVSTARQLPQGAENPRDAQ